jgi:hypothetical protein
MLPSAAVVARGSQPIGGRFEPSAKTWARARATNVRRLKCVPSRRRRLWGAQHGGSLGALLGLAVLVTACERRASGRSDAVSEDSPRSETSSFGLQPASAATGPGSGEQSSARSGELLPALPSLPEQLVPSLELLPGRRPPGPQPSPLDASSGGAASPSCIHGWVTPPRGSALRKAALDMMRSNAREIFVVDEMRYFVGPEDVEVMNPRGEVERWYVKGHVQGNRERRARWLVRRAPLGSGVVAIAAYDSAGYGPGTWVRSGSPEPSVADPFLRPCASAPAEEKCMGLPREVLGCLDGT